MAHLLYYQVERVEFKEAFDKELSNSKASAIVIRKLLKHFKLSSPSIYFTSGNRLSRAGRWSITINLEQNNFGVICHEVAHTYQCQKLMDSGYDNWHNKEHKKIMKRMINYCKKKNWFEEELNRRLSPKPAKQEPTKQEIKAQELIKIQEKIVKYEKKVLFFTRKLSKAKRSYKLKLNNLNKLQGDKIQCHSETNN